MRQGSGKRLRQRCRVPFCTDAIALGKWIFCPSSSSSVISPEPDPVIDGIVVCIPGALRSEMVAHTRDFSTFAQSLSNVNAGRGL